MSPQRILIVYGSTHGQTAKIASRIADVLADRGHLVSCTRAEEMSPAVPRDRYAGVIVGASLHVGRHQRAVERFAAAHAATLNSMPSAFFSVSASAASSDEESRAGAQRCVDRFVAITGWRPRRVAMIAGAIAYTKYNPFIRWMMKRISRRAGGATDTSRDHEYTDWGQVAHFAEDFAAMLDEARAPATVG